MSRLVRRGVSYAAPQNTADSHSAQHHLFEQNYDLVRKIQLDWESSTSIPLATGTITDALLKRHDEELERFCRSLLTILPRETSVA